MNEKELRERYGVSMAPLAATQTFNKPMEHFANGFAWVLVNGDKIAYANTYNGNAGRKFAAKWYELGDKLQKKLKGFTEVPVSECPLTS